MTKPDSVGLQKTIDSAFIKAQKAKDALTLSTLRMLRSEIKNKEIELRPKSIDDAEIIRVIGSAIKKRRDAIELYKQGGRQELADKEQKEIEILSLFLPAQLSESEVADIVAKAVKSTGATVQKDMGAVMKVVMAETKGRADGKLVSQLVKRHLGG